MIGQSRRVKPELVPRSCLLTSLPPSSTRKVRPLCQKSPLRLSSSCLSSSYYSLPPARPPHLTSPTDAPTPCGRPLCRWVAACSSTRGCRGHSTCPPAPRVGANGLLVQWQRQRVVPDGRLRQCARLQGLWSAAQHDRRVRTQPVRRKGFLRHLPRRRLQRADGLPAGPAQGQGGQGCSRGPRCAANVTSQCPSKLQAPGGCNNACTVFKQDKYCCTGNSCEPTTYAVFFVRMCPDAYSYAQDAPEKTTFTCPSGTNYQVVFCPPIDLTSSPPSPPAPIAVGPTSMASSSNKGRTFGLVLGSIGGFIFLISFILFIVHKTRSRRRQEMEKEEDEFGKLPGMPMRFTFQQLEVATERFRDKLGEGGFGSVFQGQFGEERIAVKRLERAGQGKKEFLAEVQTIGSIHHINLVRLIGFCAEKSHRLLVYEYMPKGSLDRWIYYRHDNNAPPLDWQTRRKIITHIAKGLSYLHEECMKRIAHLDVKPQNILLDDNFNAKLSDFGLCKLIDRDKSQVITRMRGTPGYLAPEWLTSQITEKADVYSFGVVVIEIISGRKNLDTSRSEESIHLITLLEEKVKNGQLVDLIDRYSNDMQVHKQDIIQMMKLAMWCLQIDCKRRPEMSVVVKVLEGTMNAETNIDHSFVVRSPTSFGVAGNVDSSAPPLASDVSGPR